MALRSSSSARTPVISGVEPRGRPGMAAIGLAVLVGGIVLWVLVAQGVVPLAPVAHVGGNGTQAKSQPTASGVTPSGSRPTGFFPIVDAQGRFALFANTTWQSKSGTITLSGQMQPVVVLAPASSALPNWRIAFPANPIPTTGFSYTDLINNLLTADGATNIIPIDGPKNAPIGLYQWSQLRLTAQLKSGAAVTIVALAQTLPSGQSVLVLETAQTLNYATVEAQDFLPMLQSLVLKG
jgi:hypothetical protein